MLEQNRQDTRYFFHAVWKKTKAKEPLEPMEAMLSEILLQHPEYHLFLDELEFTLEREFTPEQEQVNPFLHMGMHVAVQEQASVDQPAGIQNLYQRVVMKYDNAHEAEHAMMDCLGEMLWESQQQQKMPDEKAYMESLKRLL